MKKRKLESGKTICGNCSIHVLGFCAYYRVNLTMGSRGRVDKCKKEFPNGVAWEPSETVKKERKPK